MADKKTELSIVLTAVDKATSKIRAVNERMAAATKPMRDFREQLAGLREHSGLDGVITGFKGVSSAIGDLLGKVALIGGVAGAATAGVLRLIDGFDDLGDKAAALGVGVDWLRQTQYAADKSGVSIDVFNSGMKGFVTRIGQARAGVGALVPFLEKTSLPLLKQFRAAKSNEAAFDLLARAMFKLQDPAKKAALAHAAFGDAAAAPLLAQGADGIEKFRAQYAKLGKNQAKAAEAAAKAKDKMKDFNAALDGVKASIVIGLGPAIEKITVKMTNWLTAHQDDIARWVSDIGERLPGAIQEVVKWVQKAWDKVTGFVDAVGGIKNVAIGAAAILAGPLVLSVLKLGGALGGALVKLTRLRAGLAAVNGAGGAAAGAAGAAGKAGTAARGASGALAAAGPIGATIYAASVLNDISGGSIGDSDGTGDFFGAAKKMHADQLAARSNRWNKFLGNHPDMTAQVGGILGSLRGPLDQSTQPSKIVVDFANVPRGARVKVDEADAHDINLNVGYQLGGAF